MKKVRGTCDLCGGPLYGDENRCAFEHFKTLLNYHLSADPYRGLPGVRRLYVLVDAGKGGPEVLPRLMEMLRARHPPGARIQFMPYRYALHQRRWEPERNIYIGVDDNDLRGVLAIIEE